MTRRRQQGVKVAIGGAASLGIIALAVGLAVPVLPRDSQRVLCGGCRGICDVIAPQVECVPLPPRPFDGQTVAAGSVCPGRHAAINGACWVLAAAKPPCPLGTWEHGENCYTPLMLPGRKPPIPNAQEP